jgi:hypothetical protein
MTEHDEKVTSTEQPEAETKVERFPELAELQEKIQRRLRSNQRFLERFLDEDFDERDDDDIDVDVDSASEEDNADQTEEL